MSKLKTINQKIYTVLEYYISSLNPKILEIYKDNKFSIIYALYFRLDTYPNNLNIFETIKNRFIKEII